MISIELWRAKIGLFNCRRPCSRVFRLPSSFNLFAGDYRIPSVWSLGLSSSSLLKRRALVLLLVVVISHLLLSSGDVEQNPGPSKDDKPEMHQLQCMTYTNKDGNDVDFRLVDRIQPKWTRLAIALRFPMYKVQTFESKADPVIILLGEWLQRGNKEDTRPVTWATLIEALHDADLKEEADIIVEQVVTQTAHKTQSGKRFQNADGSESELGFDLVQLTEGYTIKHGPMKVCVKPDISNHLLSLVFKYAEMLQVLRKTKLLKSEFCQLKDFLSDYCDLTEGSIQKCSTVSGIIDVLKQKLKIFIFNIDVLNDTCKLFLGFEVKRSVQQYKQHLDDFLSSTIVKDFKDALESQIDSSSSDWESEKVILKLDKRRSDDNLKVLKRLVYDIFGISSKALIHCRTGAGCVCVTLLAPTTLVPTLRMKAEQHSHEYLASQGVLELVIGLRVAPNEVNIEELQPKIDSYQKMGRARDLAISNSQKRNEELESELEIVHTSKEKSDYKMMYEQQQVQAKEEEKEKFEFQEKYTKLQEMLQEKASNLKAEVQADIKTYQEKVAAKDEDFKILYNRMCAFREKCGELERLVTAVQRERADFADKYTVLEKENKMLQKQKSDLEEKHEVVKRDVEIFEQKQKERELVSLQKQKFEQEGKLGELEREIETFEQKEKDSAKVGVASVVQEDVQYHTTDGDKCEGMAPPMTEPNSELESCVETFKSGNKQMAKQLLAPHLHLAVIRTMFFLNRSANIATAEVSLLHLAAYWGWKDIAILLVTVYGCDANWKDDAGQTPLYYSVYNGHLELVKYFISELFVDPMDRNKNSSTSLHLACENGHLNIIQYLISEVHCNPSCVNNYGTTPLHKACLSDHAHIVQYLLSTGRVNPLAEDHVGRTPLSFATGKYDIIKLLQLYADCSRDYPVHTFTKLILTGDSGAGKTTIAQHIVLASSTLSRGLVARWLLPADRVANIECLTAGIVQHHVEGKLGNFVIYDFAGQQEYYSSHAAILEPVLRRTAAIFLCMIDLSKSKENICESLQYWLTFIDNASSTAEGTSHVVIIGSHADQVTSSKEIKEKRSLLQEIAASTVKCQKYAGCVTMDCRYANTAASRQLISILTNTKEAITASQPTISCYCHVLYAFLHTKLQLISCTLQNLISAIAKEKNFFFPSDPSVLTELLTILCDKGLILFIQHPRSSWVFVKTAVLLSDINGTLFAPHLFKEHHDFASNTGIVPTSNLRKVFPQYNPDMLLSFLVSLEFCQPVHPSVLQYTNLQSTPSHSTADLLFFPGLIWSERPDSLIQLRTLEFGWCLGCMDPHKFFSSHFLNVLLLSVAYKYPLANPSHPHSSVSGLQRMCTIWRSGICWKDNNDITTVVELLDNNRWVLVAMSRDHTSPIQHAELRSSLIALVLYLQQKHCPHLDVSDFLISPDFVRQYPNESLPSSDLFHIHHVARSILLHNSVVPSHRDGSGLFSLHSLPFEPYHVLSPSLVCQLHNPNMADQRVPVDYLHEAQQICQHFSKMMLLVYKELREQIDKLSIFAGRNPLELAELKKEDITSNAGLTTGAGDPTSILSIDDLPKVKRSLRSILDWQSLGLELGLLYPTLVKIKTEQYGRIEDCKTEMLVAWLQQQDNVGQRGCVPSWSTLQTAVRMIGENELAVAELKEEDIAKIKISLRKVLDWKTLGLELGLLYPTLDKIEKEQHGMIDKCKTKMLSAWLQLEDNVSQYGVPSWSTLQTALRNIGKDEIEVVKLKKEDISSITGLTTDAGDALSIDDLFKVKMSLEKVKMSLKKGLYSWKTLGQELGLFDPTLDRIEIEQDGSIDECETTMLAAWLQQEDDVSQHGVPSWSTLQTALRNIGEDEIEVVELKEEDICSTARLTTGAGDASSILSIDDLFEVNWSLRTLLDWQFLGLALGLLYPTLKKIEKEHRRTKNCKLEMLVAWLEQEDNVSWYGVPSWSTLQTALRNIGENELAREIN